MKLILQFLAIIIITLISKTAFSKAMGDHPASIVELTIESFGERMSGFAYLAAGSGVHPTILLLHGYPGNEKNLDVAQAMRSKGWNVVFFHYRGSWGSEGEFSLRGAEQDVQVVLQYMFDKKNADRLGIDRNQISIVGHSMGGHMAIAGILDNPTVKCSVTYDGANMGANSVGVLSDPETTKIWKNYSDSLFMLAGWSGTKLLAETRQYGAKLDLVKRVDKIKGRSVMIIAANTDVISMELHIKPLVTALRATKNSQISYKLIEDDHSFSSSRTELINTTEKFLNTHCKN